MLKWSESMKRSSRFQLIWDGSLGRKGDGRGLGEAEARRRRHIALLRRLGQGSAELCQVRCPACIVTAPSLLQVILSIHVRLALPVNVYKRLAANYRLNACIASSHQRQNMKYIVSVSMLTL